MCSPNLLAAYFVGIVWQHRLIDSLLFTCDMIYIGVSFCVVVLWEEILLSFISVKHAELQLYGARGQSKAKWHERFLLFWHGLKLPKVIIFVALGAAIWLSIVISMSAADQTSYSDVMLASHVFLISLYFITGVLLAVFGFHLAAVLNKIGNSGDARSLRLRILCLSIPAALCIFARGLYFLITESSTVHETPLSIAFLGIATENLPCCLLLILMWPMPQQEDDPSAMQFASAKSGANPDYKDEILPDEPLSPDQDDL